MFCSGVQSSRAVGLCFKVYGPSNFDRYFKRKGHFSELLLVFYIPRDLRAIFLNFLIMIFYKIMDVFLVEIKPKNRRCDILNDRHENLSSDRVLGTHKKE